MIMPEHIHFVGIGGISMSGIAEILLRQGHQVSGSDLEDSHLLEGLRRSGAMIYLGHQQGNVAGADLVVRSSAIPLDNPELIAAEEQGIPIIKRAQMIARLMEGKQGIAISGTHGKTTTTSMVSTILTAGRLDPVILIGGELNTIGGNAHLGRGNFFVTEADESDGSFLYFNPQVVVVTNIEMDHHDFYQSNQQLISAFQGFLNNLPEDGKAIVYAEDQLLFSLIDPDDPRYFTYGIEQGILRAIDIKLLPFGSFFTLVYKETVLGEINLQIPGKHNILNALAAIAVAMTTGLEFGQIKKGIEQYTGVNRRFEKKGLIGDILVVDDYAHHPTEIKETLKAALNTGYERIIAVFQPHRYSRTKFLLREFAQSFDQVDHLIITDIYGAGEKPIPGVSSEELARLIAKNKGNRVDFIAHLEDIVNYLPEIIKSRDLIITIGAGDVYRAGELLLERMKKQKEMA